MASIHRVKRSSKWHCSFFDLTSGKWRLRSTGTADEKEAEAVCLRFESLSRQAAPVTEGKVPAECSGELLEAALSIVQTARRGELSEATGRAFVNRILRATRQDEIDGGTARAFLENWLSGRKLSRAFKTGEKYQTTVSLFLKSLGKRAESPLASITVRDIERFRDARSKEVSSVTTRGDIKILSAAFTVARKQGAIHSNPCEAVDMPRGDGKTRDAFAPGDVALLLAATDSEEWKTTILLSFYAGMRLGDAVSLKWDSVDFSSGVISYRASKTKSVVEIPMHPTLQAHLEAMAGDSAGTISPALALQKIPGRSGLSRQFMEIMRAAGIDPGKVDGKNRTFSKLSFHSLRHGFVSAMANAGIAPELRQKLAGHSSGGSHRKYTHLELWPLREAIGKIPHV